MIRKILVALDPRACGACRVPARGGREPVRSSAGASVEAGQTGTTAGRVANLCMRSVLVVHERRNRATAPVLPGEGST